MTSESCPRCQSEMKVRNGNRGKFLGCSQYFTTGCRGTRPYVEPTIRLTEENCRAGLIQCWQCPFQGKSRCFLLQSF